MAGTPVIIRKVRKHDHEHHGGAWKVAYADMVTALMALFIVLWILGQDDVVISQVSGYFNDPAGFVGQAASNSLEGGNRASDVSLDAEDKPPPPPPESQPDAKTPTHGTGEGRSPDRRWREAAESIRDALRATPSYARYRDQIELSVTPEGLRINLVEAPDQPLFNSGATELSENAAELFRTLGEQLARLPNQVAIEGHTDASPARRGQVGNWEISTSRANTARRALVDGGIHPERILEIVGYADRQLYNPLDPADSRNRRVSITLLSKEAVGAREKLAQEKVLR
jgi:chemotaxis protein MotB